LCGATHDYEDAHFTLNSSPIVIGEQVWIAADVFIGPGVSIGDGAVVGARSSVFKDVAPWTVVVGNPARYLKDRVIQ
jgi:putative colanic acid biosynthesis acetyltransferase WcaF